MKQLLTVSLIVVLFTACGSQQIQNEKKVLTYELDLTNYHDDLFHVTVFPILTAENKIYNFASTAPGVYKLLNFGRFVKSFNAFDENGNVINTKKISTNKWEISQPEDVYKIIYTIEDTYDADISENLISPMSGTAIDDKFALVNNFGVFGYFDNMQDLPIKLKIEYPNNWLLGTALDESPDGYYYAESFDHFADSPILLGELTKASTLAGDIKVDMYTYSDSQEIYADTLIKLSEPILNASAEFIGYTPVDRYTFLTVFMSMDTYQKQNLWGAGALEHSYSSVYGLPITPETLGSVSGTISHEFFHIMTPLNLHSDIIENYNWSEPKASQHLWMYEGLTEWASEILQYRSGLISLEEYLNTIREKINRFSYFDNSLSLTNVSENTYDQEMLMQFQNFYQKGSVVNSLLDILLLDLSNGEKGLKEVFIELSKEYGKHKSFKDNEFFNIFVNETYPQVGEFFDKYVKDTLSLPIAEYFNKIGIKLIPEKIPEDNRPRMGLSFMPTKNKEILLQKVADEAKEFGFRDGDIVVKFLGEEAKFETFMDLIQKSRQMKIGDEYEVVVNRDGEEILIKAKMLQRILHNVLEPVEHMSAHQQKLFDAWSKNL